MQCQACGDEGRQEIIWRIDRPKNALDTGHTLFCCEACGHVYGVLEAEPNKLRRRSGRLHAGLALPSASL